MTSSSIMSTNPQDLSAEILECQRQALKCKREGDIPKAKEWLLQAKQLQAQLESLKNQPSSSEATAAAKHQKSSETALAQNEEVQQNLLATTTTAPTETSTAASEDVDDKDEIEDEENLLHELNDDDDEHSGSHDADTGVDTSSPTTFSLEEMLNVDMMKDLWQVGLPVPSQEDFQAMILKCKQKALQYKQQQQQSQALQQLRYAKQLQSVHEQLSTLMNSQTKSNSGTDSDIYDSNNHDMSPEDQALLQELMMDTTPDEDDGMHGALEGTVIVGDDGHALNESSVLECSELLSMEWSEIRDAVGLVGMTLPTTEKLQEYAQYLQKQALFHKQAGDLEKAKQGLLDFKSWSQKVHLLEQMRTELETKAEKDIVTNDKDGREAVDGEIEPTEIKEEDLEALLEREEKSRKATTAPPVKPKQPTSEEFRQKAIALRDAGNIPEAAQVLKEYKLTLAREAEEKEQEKQQEIIREMQEEVRTARLQLGRYRMWEQLVDSSTGQQQLQGWFRYADVCTKVQDLIQSKGIASVEFKKLDVSDPSTLPAGSLRSLPEDMTAFCRDTATPMDERLEVSILEVTGLQSQKAWKTLSERADDDKDEETWFQLEAVVSIPLPQHHDESSQSEEPVELHFQSTPTPLSEVFSNSAGGDEGRVGPSLEMEWKHRGMIRFDDVSTPNPQFIPLERGESKLARTIERRMQRRKVTITLTGRRVENPSTPKRSSGWFGKKHKPSSNQETVQFGKVVLETKDLLDHQCIVGDFKLLGAGKRRLGGSLRCCLRTGVAFGSDHANLQTAATESESSLPLYPALKFQVNKPKAANKTD